MASGKGHTLCSKRNGNSLAVHSANCARGKWVKVLSVLDIQFPGLFLQDFLSLCDTTTDQRA